MQVQITRTGIIKAGGDGTSTSTLKARSRIDNAYDYDHSDFTTGFIEIDNTKAKFADTTVEANQFYEI